MQHIIAFALVTALAACGPAAAPVSTPTAETTTGKPDTAASAPSMPTALQLTSADLVGRWGDNGDCNKDIVINADGTFTSYTGGGGRWSLSGDRMTMSGVNGTFELRVAILNQRTLVITNPDGSVGTSQRC